MLLSTLYLPAAPKLLYDGCEADWVSQPWLLLPAAGAPFPGRLSSDVHPIDEVAAWLGNAHFRQLLLDVRATVRDWSGHGDFAHRGANGLPLHYVRRGRNLWVLAAGERQPGRYQTFLHGLWQLSTAD